MSGDGEWEALDDAIFGPASGQGVGEAEAAGGGTGDPMVALFREAGLCEEGAEEAAVGLASGHYFSFEDAALSQTIFDPQGRNLAATPQRIAEAGRKVVARAGHSEVSEAARGSADDAAFDLLDDAVFGPINPGQGSA